MNGAAHGYVHRGTAFLQKKLFSVVHGTNYKGVRWFIDAVMQIKAARGSRTRSASPQMSFWKRLRLKTGKWEEWEDFYQSGLQRLNIFANDSQGWSLTVALALPITEKEAAAFPNTSDAENNSCSNKTAIKRTNIWAKWRAHHWTRCCVSQCRLIELMHVLLRYLLVPSLCSQSPKLLAPFVLSLCLTYCVAMEESVFWKWCIAHAWTLWDLDADQSAKPSGYSCKYNC